MIETVPGAGYRIGDGGGRPAPAPPGATPREQVNAPVSPRCTADCWSRQAADGPGSRLIEGLLLLAVSDEGLRRRRVALDETVTTVTGALAAEAKERDITVEVTARPVTVEGDAVLLASCTWSPMCCATTTPRAGPCPSGSVGRAGGRHTVPEVAPATVPLLFEPFRRARARRHAPGEGAGLGLSIVASVARAHGGDVGARANPGGGLTARVTLPPGTRAPAAGESCFTRHPAAGRGSLSHARPGVRRPRRARSPSGGEVQCR
ncbi:hypothetical protein SBADM41S_01983 [Streptomyces badius]